MLEEFREQLFGGVGMLLSPPAYNYLEGNMVVMNSQITVANFSGSPATTIICCYSPTNCSDDNDALDVCVVNNKL